MATAPTRLSDINFTVHATRLAEVTRGLLDAEVSGVPVLPVVALKMARDALNEWDRDITAATASIDEPRLRLIDGGSYSETYERACPNCGEQLEWLRYLAGKMTGQWQQDGETQVDACPVCERELPDNDPVSDELAARRAR